MSATVTALSAVGCGNPGHNATHTHQAQETKPKPVVAPLQIPPLAFKARTLPNGLTVYSARDNNTASVTVQVWNKVGSKDDPEGRSGFAHLFEHLMFKATRNLPPETFDRLTEDVGGSNNAFTADDTTAYYEIVPAKHLQRILFAEAERMGSLVVDQAAFVSERDVVKEELRQRVLANPYGRLFSHLPAARDVRRCTLTVAPASEVWRSWMLPRSRTSLRFHTTFYRPDNAYLGRRRRLRSGAAGCLGRSVLRAHREAQRALPVNNVPEPARTEPRAATYYAPNVPLPAVTISWQLPRYADDDAAALMVLDDVLSVGASSRLYRSLVYEQQIAAEASSSTGLQQQAGSITAYALMSEGHDLDEGETALLADSAKLRDAPSAPPSVDEAKRELIAGSLRSREGVLGRAQERQQPDPLGRPDRRRPSARRHSGDHRSRRPARRPHLPHARQAHHAALPRREREARQACRPSRLPRPPARRSS